MSETATAVTADSSMGSRAQRPEEPAGRRSRFWKRAQIALALVLLLAIVFQADPEQVLRSLASARPLPAALCVFSVVVSYYLRSLTFALIARPFARLTVAPVFLFTLIGAFFSNVLPGQIGGDVVKGAYLVRYFQSGSGAYAAVAMHRLTGFAGTLLAGGVLCLAMSFQGRETLLRPAILLSAGAVLLVVVPCFWGKVFRAGRHVFPRSRAASSPVAGHARRFADALEAYSGHPVLITVSALCSALVSLQGAFTFMLAARAVGLRQSAFEGIAAALFAQLSAVLPLTPGGAGVAEHAYVAACAWLGYPGSAAAAAALLFRLCMLIVGCAGGILYLRVPLPAPDAVKPPVPAPSPASSTDV